MEGQTRRLRLTGQRERLAGLAQESNTHVVSVRATRYRSHTVLGCAFSAARTSPEGEGEGSTGPQGRGLGRTSSKGLRSEITKNVVEKRQDEGGKCWQMLGPEDQERMGQDGEQQGSDGLRRPGGWAAGPKPRTSSRCSL